MKFEAARLIHFSGDVFAPVVVVVAKAPEFQAVTVARKWLNTSSRNPRGSIFPFEQVSDMRN